MLDYNLNLTWENTLIQEMMNIMLFIVQIRYQFMFILTDSKRLKIKIEYHNAMMTNNSKFFDAGNKCLSSVLVLFKQPQVVQIFPWGLLSLETRLEKDLHLVYSLGRGGKKEKKLTKNTRQSVKICNIFKKALLLSSIFYAFPNAIDPMLYKSTNIIKGTVYPSEKRHQLSCGAELK